jgi:Flp pilus assembly pilin Flp
MMNFIKNFRNDEDGAVTVDWVVLTAAVVGLAIAAYSSIQTGATGLTANTSDFLTSQTVGGGLSLGGGGTGGGEEVVATE